MRLQVAALGKGTEDDPYRAPLPTYTLVYIDYQNLVAVVDVPDDVYSINPKWPTKNVRTPDGKTFQVYVPPTTALQEWEAKEADLYPAYAKERRLRDILIR